MGFWVALVVKNSPAHAGDASSIPDPGRFHLPCYHAALVSGFFRKSFSKRLTTEMKPQGSAVKGGCPEADSREHVGSYLNHSTRALMNKDPKSPSFYKPPKASIFPKKALVFPIQREADWKTKHSLNFLRN